MEQTLDISWKTIGKILMTVFLLYVIFLARHILIWLFFAFVISLLVEPAIRFLRWLKIPKVLAVVAVYLSILGVLGLVIYLTAPLFAIELGELAQNIPAYFETINPLLKELGISFGENFEQLTVTLATGLKESSGSILKAIFTFFGGVASTFFIFTLAFFISLEERGPERLIGLITPARYEANAIELFSKAQSKVSLWFGTRILACPFVGVVSFIVFLLFSVKYAFTLGLLAGVLNFVPYIGPVITLLVSAVFTAASGSWTNALYVSIALLVIQEAENKFVSPLLMKKFMDLPPVLVLVSLLIGGAVFGFMGTLFAVPVFGLVYEFVKEFLERRKQESSIA